MLVCNFQMCEPLFLSVFLSFISLPDIRGVGPTKEECGALIAGVECWEIHDVLQMIGDGI